ncbi:uncharacterized protein LOC122258593 [Penaeus japonicus]|uniref:uncharacterized protein LOC122258593 n=1 Tax=Penaeus japonicus TaxID=27405 RepID=UPI001C71232C|nr:uncharacterized protein LOC122258593 [Penaeus japonicus]
MQVWRQTFSTCCLVAASLNIASSQNFGRPLPAPQPDTIAGTSAGDPYSPEDTADGRDLLSEGLGIPLLWGSPASIQIPALMLFSVVLIFFTAVARDSFLSLLEGPRVPPRPGQRPPIGSMGAGRRPMAGRALLREDSQLEAFTSSIIEATDDLKFL